MSQEDEARLALVKSKIGEFPDFPKAGINFKYVNYKNILHRLQNNLNLLFFRDIFTALLDGATCVALKELLINYVKKNHPSIDAVVGLDARGFLFSFTIASELGIGCIPIRKKGKLPGETHKVEYTLEYGTDVFELQCGAIKNGQKVLIVDDLLATGGTLKAACELVRKAGGVIDGCLVVMELKVLNGRANLNGTSIHSFIQYDD